MGKTITLRKSSKDPNSYKNSVGVPKTLANEGLKNVKGFGTKGMTLEEFDEYCDQYFLYYPDDRNPYATCVKDLPVECQPPGMVLMLEEKRRQELQEAIDEEEMEATNLHDQFIPGDWQDYVTAAGVPLKKYLKQVEEQNYQKWLAKMEKAHRVMDEVVDMTLDNIPGSVEPMRPRRKGHLRKDIGQRAQDKDFPRQILLYDEDFGIWRWVKMSSGHPSSQPRYKKSWRRGGHDHRSLSLREKGKTNCFRF